MFHYMFGVQYHINSGTHMIPARGGLMIVLLVGNIVFVYSQVKWYNDCVRKYIKIKNPPRGRQCYKFHTKMAS